MRHLPAAIAASLEPLQKRIDDLDSRVKITTATVTLHTGSLDTLGQRVETVAQAEAAARDPLLRTINSRIDRLGRP